MARLVDRVLGVHLPNIMPKARIQLVRRAIALLALLAACAGGEANGPVPVGSIVLRPTELRLTVGQNERISVTLIDPAGQPLGARPLRWSSADPQVAGVSADGVVTAVAPGQTRVTATAEGTSAALPVTVLPLPVAAVEIGRPSPILRVGATSQLTASLRDAAGRPLEGRTVMWSSANDSIAAVSTSGLVTARRPGNTLITATSEGLSAQATLSVTLVPVSSVVIEPPTASLTVGQTRQLTATVRDSVGSLVTDRLIQWTTSDATRATVAASGLVSALAPGAVTIVASIEDRVAESRLTIAPVPVASITVQVPQPQLEIGATQQLTVVMRDAGGLVLTGRPVTWTSSEPSRVAISSTGLITGVSPGTSVVTAVAEGRAGSATVSVAAPPAGLTSIDSTVLSRHLDRIAATSTWVQPSVDSANAIFTRSTYESRQWRAYFDGYFSRRPLTGPLWYYLQHPVRFWFGETVNRRLQAGFAPAASARVRAIVGRNAETLEATFRTDTTLAQSTHEFLTALRMLSTAGLEASVRSEASALAVGLARDYPAVIFGPVSAERAIRRLVAYVWMTTMTAEPLSPSRKAAIANVLRLSPWQTQLLDQHSVLVYDQFSAVYDRVSQLHDGFAATTGRQGQLDAGQRLVIEQLLRLTPSALHDLSIITVADAFGLFPGRYHCCFAGRYDGQAVISIGEFDLRPLENAFPADVQARMTPLFSTILVHELNHVVDFVKYERDPAYKRRRDELIAAAGRDSLNYLRSMVPSGLFFQAPVELLASVSQAWLADSELVLRLGVQRFDAGRREPLHQALWIAEVYSGGSSIVPLYRMTDPSGALTRVDAPLTRNAAGHITSITVGDSTYTFVREANGNVASHSVRPSR